MWDSAICVAAGPLSLAYRADGLSDDASRLNQLRGMARLLREALARRLPVMLSCDGEAEADLAQLVLAALAKAPPAALPLPTPRPAMRGLPASTPSTPLLVYESVGLWERLHAAQPWCAFMLFDGTLTHAKAPRALLNAAYDVPIERLLLASSAPRHAPAQPAATHGAESRRGGRLCHPAHVAHTAERLAAIRSTAADTVDTAAILTSARESARLVFPALGLPSLPPAAPASSSTSGAPAPVVSDLVSQIVDVSCEEATSSPDTGA
jgi:Tat protein secretion system quality control protein TatD with DNase activity